MEDRAGFWIRFLAYIIDGIIVGIINSILVLIFKDNPNVTSVIGLIIWLIYYVWYQSLNGQTIGKRFLSIKVVKMDGSQVGIGTMFLRDFIGEFISAIILFIGFLMAAGPEKRALHDRIAGTKVIKV